MIGDLCLPLDDVEQSLHRERVAALLTRGYDVVASVHTATGRLTEADRCSLSPLSADTLATASADAKRTLALRAGTASAVLVTNIIGAAAAPAGNLARPSIAAAAAAGGGHLRQLTRLHFVAADAVQAAQLAASDEIVRSYDIVSITPKSERVLHQACASLDVDIVSLELSQRSAFKLRAPAVKAALRRGVYFEICYAPGLREATARRNLFCNAQALVRMTRGKNILLSGSARSAFEVRSPLELVHMATLFGLTRQQAQDAVRLAPKAVLAHAAARLAGKGGAAAAAAPGVAAEAADTEMQDADEEPAAERPAQAPQARTRQQQQQPKQGSQPGMTGAQQQQPQQGGVATRGSRKRTAAVS